jgi:hypothetical protein
MLSAELIVPPSVSIGWDVVRSSLMMRCGSGDVKPAGIRPGIVEERGREPGRVLGVNGVLAHQL